MDINLLSGYQQSSSRRKSSASRTVALVFLGIAVVFLGGAMDEWLTQRVHHLKGEEATLQKQLLQPAVSGQPSPNLQTNHSSLRAVQAILDKRHSLNTMLSDIHSDLVTGMTVDAVHTASGGLQLTGRAQNIGEVAAFDEHLTQRAWVSSADVQNIELHASGTSSSSVFAKLPKGVAMRSLGYEYTVSITLSNRTGGKSKS